MLRQYAGVSSTVLTSRWHSSWPAESECRETRIVRLLPAPRSAWTETLFLRNVGVWLARHRSQFDAVYIEDYPALVYQVGQRSVIGDMPWITGFGGVRLPPGLPANTVAWSVIAQACDACRKANWVIASSTPAQRQLLSAGILAEKILRIPPVAWQSFLRTPQDRHRAARALRQASQDFTLPRDYRLLTCFGELQDAAIWKPAVEGMIRLLDRGLKLRVWIVGQGAVLAKLYERVKESGYHHDILFHGPFDQLDDLLQLSDGVLLPDSRSGFEYILPTALASAIPFLGLTPLPGNEMIPDCLHSLLIEEPTADSFSRRLEDWYIHHPRWLALAEDARQSLVAGGVHDQTRRQWVDLMRKLQR